MILMAAIEKKTHSVLVYSIIMAGKASKGPNSQSHI